MTSHYWIAALAAIAAPVSGATTNVEMRNASGGQFMVFAPTFVRVAPGDTVTFKAIDKGHDAETIASMLPAGAQPFKGKMGQDVSVTFTKPGLYGIKCNPHFGMGMVALVQVGPKPASLDAARAAAAALPGLARKTMAALLAQVR